MSSRRRISLFELMAGEDRTPELSVMMEEQVRSIPMIEARPTAKSMTFMVEVVVGFGMMRFVLVERRGLVLE